jgi:uncharacterized membrane protein YhhN
LAFASPPSFATSEVSCAITWSSQRSMRIARPSASILAVTAWLTFVAGAIVWATDAGVSWPVALMVAGATNLVLAAGLAVWVKGQAGELAFAATLRQLRRTADEARSEAS